jgi:hypothetical protein
MARQRVTISVDEAHRDRLTEVLERCKQTGFEVDQQLEGIGVVTGSIDNDRVDELRGLPGVAAVEPEHTYQLPDPDSPIQ